MWKELIQNLTKISKFRSSVDRFDISKAETALGVSLPNSLTDLLAETDGVEGEYSLGLIWPIKKIVNDNLSFRRNPDFGKLYMSFDNLLFFADAGNGDQFAFTILSGVIRRPDTFIWNHEDDSRTWVAPSLQQYLKWWLTGKLKI